MNENQADENEVMSYRGLSAYLKISQGSLRLMVMRGQIPFNKIYKKVRFQKKVIDAWLEEKKQQKKHKGNKNKSGLFSADGSSGMD